MNEERKQIVDEITWEVEGISNIAVMSFLLNVIKSFKKNRKWGTEI